MKPIAVQSSVPTGGPDTLRAGDPPGTLLLPRCRRLLVRAHSSSGAAALRPYSWTGGRWAGAGYDAAATIGEYPLTVNSASGNGTGERAFTAPDEGRFWILVQESGAGTVDQALVEPIS